MLMALSLSFDAEAQYKRRKRSAYGYQKNSQKKFSKYSGGRVGYSGVGNPKYATVGVSINTTSYFGDLSASPGKFSTDYIGAMVPDGLGLTYSKVMYPGIFFRGGFNWGNIKGEDYRDESKVDGNDPSDRGRYARNYHFKNSILELSAGFEADLIPSNSGARGRFPVNPYVFVGVAGFYHNPKAKAPATDQAGNDTGKGRQWVALHPLKTGTEDYSKFQLAVPIGLGSKFKVSRYFDVNLEFGLRYTFFDYLDDVGGNYRDLASFDDPLARAMSERGGETSALLSNKPRTLSTYETRNNGNGFYYASQNGDYFVGENYFPGKPRGGKTNDFYVMTQIRLVYILDKKGVSKGKFR